MLNKFKFRLDLFGDGSGAAPSGASGGNATAGSPSADATTTGVEGAVAEPKENATEGAEPKVEKSREERRKAYDAFIKGEGKEFFEEDTKNIVSKRVKEGKALKEQVDKYPKTICVKVKGENIGKFNDWAQKAGKNFGWKYRTAFNPDEGFGEWLRDWQRANGKWRDSKIYNMNMTTGAEMPRGEGLRGKIKNGR